jgi:hypothetical protein
MSRRCWWWWWCPLCGGGSGGIPCAVGLSLCLPGSCESDGGQWRSWLSCPPRTQLPSDRKGSATRGLNNVPSPRKKCRTWGDRRGKFVIKIPLTPLTFSSPPHLWPVGTLLNLSGRVSPATGWQWCQSPPSPCQILPWQRQASAHGGIVGLWQKTHLTPCHKFNEKRILFSPPVLVKGMSFVNRLNGEL